MSKKISPLSDDSVIAPAMLLMMLDHLDKCADLIEGCKNASERAEVVACLRTLIANVKESYTSVNSVVYVSAHVEGQKSLPQQARNVRLARSGKLNEYLEKHWFSLDKKPPQDAFVKEHYSLFCKWAYDTDSSANNSKKKIKKITEKQFKRRLSPSQRRKSVAP
jgi:hypothetical protein